MWGWDVSLGVCVPVQPFPGLRGAATSPSPSLEDPTLHFHAGLQPGPGWTFLGRKGMAQTSSPSACRGTEDSCLEQLPGLGRSIWSRIGSGRKGKALRETLCPQQYLGPVTGTMSAPSSIPGEPAKARAALAREPQLLQTPVHSRLDSVASTQSRGMEALQTLATGRGRVPSRVQKGGLSGSACGGGPPAVLRSGTFLPHAPTSSRWLHTHL